MPLMWTDSSGAQPDRAKASAAGRTLIADEREFLDLPRCYFQSKCRPGPSKTRIAEKERLHSAGTGVFLESPFGLGDEAAL